MTHDNIDILVVDDDISHCTILQALLRGWGYNVALGEQRATGVGAGAGTGF
ncbi:two-component system response regulator [Escherichia coli]|nr:two-component system response regulator [Escherichia coli]